MELGLFTLSDLITDPKTGIQMNAHDRIDETIKALGTDADEILTERVGFLRDATGRGDSAFTTKFNDMFAGH